MPSLGTFLREEVLALGCFLKVEAGGEVLCFLLGDSGGVERGEDEVGLTGFFFWLNSVNLPQARNLNRPHLLRHCRS